jgi:hypothetical protein
MGMAGRHNWTPRRWTRLLFLAVGVAGALLVAQAYLHSLVRQSRVLSDATHGRIVLSVQAVPPRDG